MWINNPLHQISYLLYEIKLMINRRWWRIVSVFFSQSTWAIISYRIDRFLYLLFGRIYGLLRIFLLPIIFLTQPWRGRCEIHYRADIGKGLKILHPSLGVVISGKAVCGEHLTLTGGNCIGGKAGLEKGGLLIGNHVSLGANASIIGPVKVGSHVTVGAGAVVVHDAPDNVVLVGVPAKPISK